MLGCRSKKGCAMIEVLVFNNPIKVWELLAVLGIVLAALEIFAPGFILLPIGLAFLLTAGAALFLTTWLSILVALAASLGFLIWLFHFKLKLGMPNSVLDTNASAMVGKEVRVTAAILGSSMGEVKLYGDRFTAYSISKRNYDLGELAKIVIVDGNKVALD